MPTATTPTKAAMSGGRSTLRRMIVSGKESPMTAIMKASTVPSAAPFSRRAWTTGMMPAAFEYMGTPSRTAAGTDHRADRDSRHHVRPDLADDLANGLAPLGEAFFEELRLVVGGGLGGRQLVDPRLDEALEAHAPEGPACSDRDHEAGSQVERSDLPAKEPEEQDERHLVHHGRRDEKGERDAERDPGLDEADEERHRRAGAEGRHDPEQGREHVPGRFSPPRQQAPGALGGEERPDDPHHEHHQHEQQQDLRDLVEEEGERAPGTRSA